MMVGLIDTNRIELIEKKKVEMKCGSKKGFM